MARKTPEKWGNGTERIAEGWEIVTTDDFFVAGVTIRTGLSDARDEAFVISRVTTSAILKKCQFQAGP
jgi:hypothetical protein